MSGKFISGVNPMKSFGRRDFMQKAAFSLLPLGVLTAVFGQKKEKKSILLRSSWQVENIGDIGHTPGVIALLETYFPDVEVRLWPKDIGKGVEPMLRNRFPALVIITSEEEVQRAFSECAFMLHGSGPSLVAGKDLAQWHQSTGKPYGIYGITFPGIYGFPEERSRFSTLEIDTLSQAKFAYFRDSVSLEFAKKAGVNCPVMEFCPDGAFAVDVKNEAAAVKFLEDHQLETGKFMCVIPQLRFTPWWELPRKKQPINLRKNERNQRMKAQDNAPIREAMIAVVRQTPLKILIVPENETQMKIGKEMLYDPLPEDVKKRVVLRDTYWLTDEAVSTYVRSAGLFGIEMHSPIMCIGNGIPAIVCRFDEQTSKGYMWRDIGLGEWLFDLDTEADKIKIVPAVLKMAKNPKAAKAKALKAKEFVEKRQKETMLTLKQWY